MLDVCQSKVVFLSKTELVDDYQDDPLLWKIYGTKLKASVSGGLPQQHTPPCETYPFVSVEFLCFRVLSSNHEGSERTLRCEAGGSYVVR